MIILKIVGGFIILCIAIQIIGRLSRFTWIPIIGGLATGTAIGIIYETVWGGIGAGFGVLFLFSICAAIIDKD